jgi:hypothetical protein
MHKKSDKRVYNKSLKEKLEDSEIEFEIKKGKKRKRLSGKFKDRGK